MISYPGVLMKGPLQWL